MIGGAVMDVALTEPFRQEKLDRPAEHLVFLVAKDGRELAIHPLYPTALFDNHNGIRHVVEDRFLSPPAVHVGQPCWF